MTVFSYVRNTYVAGVTVLTKSIMDIIEFGVQAAMRLDNLPDAASPERVALDDLYPPYASRFSPIVWTTTPTSYKVGDIFRPTGTSDWFRTVVGHTSAATVPTPANARPLDGASNYEYIAGPTSALAPRFVRATSGDMFDITMIHVSATAAAATDVVNLETMEAAIADVVLDARPCTTIAFTYNPAGAGDGWEYGGVAVTAMPAAVITGDILLFFGKPDGTVPAWSTTHHVMSSVG